MQIKTVNRFINDVYKWLPGVFLSERKFSTPEKANMGEFLSSFLQVGQSCHLVK